MPRLPLYARLGRLLSDVGALPITSNTPGILGCSRAALLSELAELLSLEMVMVHRTPNGPVLVEDGPPLEEIMPPREGLAACGKAIGLWRYDDAI